MADRTSWTVLALLAGALALAVSACSYQPGIHSARVVVGSKTVGLQMNNCGGDYSVSVTESADEVRVRVTDNRTPISFAGSDCADGVTIELDAPLGDRILVNSVDGTPIDIRFVSLTTDPSG